MKYDLETMKKTADLWSSIQKNRTEAKRAFSIGGSFLVLSLISYFTIAQDMSEKMTGGVLFLGFFGSIILIYALISNNRAALAKNELDKTDQDTLKELQEVIYKIRGSSPVSDEDTFSFYYYVDPRNRKKLDWRVKFDNDVVVIMCLGNDEIYFEDKNDFKILKDSESPDQREVFARININGQPQKIIMTQGAWKKFTQVIEKNI